MKFNDLCFSYPNSIAYPSLHDLEQVGYNKLKALTKKEAMKIQALNWLLVKHVDVAPIVVLALVVPHHGEKKAPGNFELKVRFKDGRQTWIESEQVLLVLGQVEWPEEPVGVLIEGHVHTFEVNAVKVADEVKALLNSQLCPAKVRNSNEPYRAAMYHLGYKDEDGSEWWGKVMEAIG